jgi:hypothetical protein
VERDDEFVPARGTNSSLSRRNASTGWWRLASAAALWEIRPTAAARIDISVRSAGGRAKRPGLRIHRTRRAFERERDAILARAGYRTLRYTHRQMTSDAAGVAAAIRSSA